MKISKTWAFVAAGVVVATLIGGVLITSLHDDDRRGLHQLTAAVRRRVLLARSGIERLFFPDSVGKRLMRFVDPM